MRHESNPGDAPAAARAEAPSNLALIKYMGKLDASANVASNPSLSLTLGHLRTVAVVEATAGGSDRWQPLDGETRLSKAGERRMLAFVRRLCDRWDHRGPVLVRTANNFPSDAGLASSASSFAAVTRALAVYLRRTESNDELARLSRAGSGSSCRSFYAPWCQWDGEVMQALDFPIGPLDHVAVVVDDSPKAVSSSDAHRRVVTSTSFGSRPDRARRRLDALRSALERSDWPAACSICRDEFEDMHALFETSDPPFRYRTAASQQVIAASSAVWDAERDGPLVTMDAGANVHLLFRRDQVRLRRTLAASLARRWRVLASADTHG